MSVLEREKEGVVIPMICGLKYWTHIDMVLNMYFGFSHTHFIQSLVILVYVRFLYHMKSIYTPPHITMQSAFCLLPINTITVCTNNY